jgi:hypothetical protein
MFYCFTLKNICKRKIQMPDTTRISRLSGGLRWLALVLAAVLPLIVAVAVLRAIRDPASLLAQFPSLPADPPVGPWQAGAVAALALLSVLPMMQALAAMATLFARYRAGDVLCPANADSILTIGRWLVLVALAGVAVPTAQALALSWRAPERTLRIALDGGTLGFLMAAGFLTVIGWAMREAAAVKAENEAFV